MIIFVYVFKCSLWLLAYILASPSTVHTHTHTSWECVCMCANANDVVAGVPCDFLVCINTPHNLSDNLWDSDRKTFESNSIEQFYAVLLLNSLALHSFANVFFFIHSNFITKWSHHCMFFSVFLICSALLSFQNEKVSTYDLNLFDCRLDIFGVECSGTTKSSTCAQIFIVSGLRQRFIPLD